MNDVWKMAETGQWDATDSQKLTKLASLKDEEGKTPLHIAAQHGKLSKVPSFLLTKKQITKQDKEGKTVLHYAIPDIRNGIQNIPKELLCEENLSIEDINSNTLYHMLCFSKDIDLLDKSVLKEKYLMKENSLKVTPMEYICCGEREDGKDMLKFFKATISNFSGENLKKLESKKGIEVRFLDTINKEIQKREIAKKLIKSSKTLELE
jgi:ankyrin repeat protein